MNPRVFISYSHDSDDHKQWVRALADRLIGDGVEVTVDQYELALGEMIPHFMEKGISQSDFVLLIVTQPFVAKATQREGGVGFEINLATGEIVVFRNRSKFIPVYVKLDPAAAPPFLKGALGVKIDNLFSYEQQYDQLYRTVTGQTLKKPELGTIRHLTVEPTDVAPFDLPNLAQRKRLDQWCWWDVIIDVNSLSDVSVASLYTLLDGHLHKEDLHGTLRVEPAVLSPASRRSSYPMMTYEGGDYTGYANVSKFDRLVLAQGQLRYSFVEFNTNRPFYHSAEIAEETLLLLLLILSRIHEDMSREVSFQVLVRIGSSTTVSYLASDHPFAKYARIGEFHQHAEGITANRFAMSSLNIAAIERFFNGIYELFLSTNARSDVPFLRVVHDGFVGCVDAIKRKVH